MVDSAADSLAHAGARRPGRWRRRPVGPGSTPSCPAALRGPGPALLVLALVASPLEAAAQEVEGGGDAPGDTREGAPADALDAAPLHHAGQLDLRVGAGVPVVVALAYPEGPRCSDGGAPLCAFVGSGVLDVDLSYGLSEGLALTSYGRVGLAAVQPSGSHAVQFGVGLRTYLCPSSMWKVFVGARVVVDVTDGSDVPRWTGLDLGVRGELGAQVDLVRHFGLFAALAVNVLLVRGFGVSPDLTGGVSVRVP